MGGVSNLIRAVLRKSDLNDRGGAVFCDIEAVRVVAIDQHHAFGGDDVEQAAEARLDLVEVAVDVGVVELDVVHDHEFGEVVDEFRAFVEEGGVVFVAFDNEILRVADV